MQLEQVLEDCNSIDFECGEDELNDFIINDAADYHRSLLAESYLLKDDGHVIAYITILNDSLDMTAFEDNDGAIKYVLQYICFAHCTAFSKYVRSLCTYSFSISIKTPILSHHIRMFPISLMRFVLIRFILCAAQNLMF